MTTQGKARPGRWAPRLPAGWVLWLLATPAAVSIWSGWVGLGQMSGFGVVHPLPGIADDLAINSAITLPIGVEAYSAYAMGTWLSGKPMSKAARTFAAWSAMGALLLGLLGQGVYHWLTAQGHQRAPLLIVVGVACLPVLVLGAAAMLHHLRQRPADPTTVAAHTAPAGTQPAAAATQAAVTRRAPAGELPAPAPARRRATTGGGKRRTRRGRPRRRLLREDYLALARTALDEATEPVEPTPAWCQQVTGCGKTLAQELAKQLATERRASSHTPTTPVAGADAHRSAGHDRDAAVVAAGSTTTEAA